MISERTGGRRAALALTAALAVAGLPGCGLLDRSVPRETGPPVTEAQPTVRTPPPVVARPACPPAGARDAAPIDALLAYYGTLRGSTEIGLLRARALAAPGEDAFVRMCQAIVLSQPGSAADLPRARALLDAVMSADDDDARAVHPLARLLADDLLERERLGRLLERLDVRLQASEQARAAMQKKLEELTEIERSLPARAFPDASLPSPTEPAPRREAR
jgi:hypothetical protein